MKIALILLIALIAGVLLIFFFLRNRQSPAAESDEMFVAASSESAARAARLLPVSGSEDRSDLLKLPELPSAPADDGNYRPDPKVDWSVTVAFPKETKVEKAVVLGGFDGKWAQANGGPQFYGKAADDGRWTFLRAADAPELYTELAFAWRLVKASDASAQPVSAAELNSHLTALRKRLSVIGEPDLKLSASPESAADAARGLVELATACDRQAVIVLKAPADHPFDGRKIWDAMISLGLKWGDMDMFHWVNSSDIGDDSFFDVWTSTSPGYFLPEQIAADRVRTADLVFGFSIPRCAAPQSVLASMAKAAEYAQQRLGGELLSDDGRPLDVPAIQKQISAIEQRLKTAGLQPGMGSALCLF